MTEHLPSRSEIEQKYLWNAEAIFADRDRWRQEYDSVAAALPQLKKFENGLADSPSNLLRWFNSVEKMQRRLDRLRAFAVMASNVDSHDESAASMYGQVISLFSRYFEVTAFADPEILTIGMDRLELWIKDTPDLGVYRHYFQDLYRSQSHVRSPEVEELLGMVADPFTAVSNIRSALVNADLEFPPATGAEGQELPVTQGTVSALLCNTDRDIRRTTWEGYADKHLEVKNALANNLMTSVKQDVFVSKARRHKSSLEAALFPYNIPIEVFHSLIDTFRKNLPVWHRYWALRQDFLGVETLAPYDIRSPLTGETPTIPYEQAVDFICDGMLPLGEEYVSIMRRGCLQERWVDVYPNVGKRQGAFSVRSIGTHPFIMMSYTNDLRSMSTLAHELGHSMHAYYSWHAQPRIYMNYSIFVAEVASNFNQAMVRAHLLSQATDRAFKISVIEEAMLNFHRYFFIMPTLARFELEIHERTERGQGTSVTDMINILADLYAEGYGDKVSFDRERVGIEWAQFGHLFVAYYTFQYATGISGAHALSHKILDGEPGSVEGYLDFLRTGSSMYPIDALKAAGADLSTPEVVERTFHVMAGLIDELESLLAAI